MPVQVITEFSGANRFLSNFWPSEITVFMRSFPTVEHAFQAAKTDNPEEIEAIRISGTPGNAKRLGRKVSIRSNWELLKDEIMIQLIRKKFEIPELKEKLLATKAYLIEGNDWGDTYWGFCDGEGQNKLGNILMQVRKEIRTNGTT